MVSINESLKGLNGDGWGTTMSKEEQLAHLRHVEDMNNSYEKERKRELAEMGIKFVDRDTNLSNMKTSFIDGFLHEEIHEENYELFEELKTKHAKDIIALVARLDIMMKRIETLESDINEMKVQKESYFSKIKNFFRKYLRLQ